MNISFDTNVIIKNDDNTTRFRNDSMHYIAGFNLLSGVRVTIKKTKLIRNNDKISKEVKPEIRPEIYHSSARKYETEDMDIDVDNSYIKKDKAYTYKNKGGDSIYISGVNTYNEAIEKLNPILRSDSVPYFKQNETISIVFEYLFYNVNYGYLLYMAQGFLLNHQSTVTLTNRTIVIDPKLHSTSTKSKVWVGFLYTDRKSVV